MTRVLAALVLALLATPAVAVDVARAWARPTVPGQTASGAYMTLTATEPSRLVGVTSPRAGVVQVHEMAMHGTTMTMHAVKALELPAGKPVELKPGGYHVMLMDLKQPLARGDKLPLTLKLEGADRRVVEQVVSVDVRDAAPD